MWIVHVYKDYYPVVGGIENHVRLLAEAQAALGHEVTVLVTSPSRRTTHEHLGGVEVIKAGRLAHLASTPLSLSLPLELHRIRADVAHLHFPYPVGEVAQLFFGRSRATVLSYHSDVVKQQTILRFYRPLMERLLNKVDRILVATPNYLETSEVLQRHRNKCVVLPYGILRSPFLAADPDKVRRIRGKHAGRQLLLFVGVLRYYKGLQYLIEAMAQIDATLLIVGDGPMRASLEAQIQSLGLQGRVILVGRLADEELPVYYHAADVFVLPASERSEAFGLVQVEAMTAGKPVVCTELGTGTSFVNRDGESGLVVPPRNPEALAAALNRILGDKPLRERLAQGARARSALFDLDRMVQEIMQVYDEALSRP